MLAHVTIGEKLHCEVDHKQWGQQAASFTLAVRRCMPGRAVMSRATPRLALQAARAAAAPLLGSCWGRPGSLLLEGPNAAAAANLGVDEPCTARNQDHLVCPEVVTCAGRCDSCC